MTNVLIPGLSELTLEQIDAEASHLGLSRNEFLRRKLEGSAPRSDGAVACSTELNERPDGMLEVAGLGETHRLVEGAL